ncbi:hypothetical protein BCV72DRAFT_233830 [Rhizopus microsporus var. microsporus]|uniref:Uncharacterized protein n=2 Tax=Rhizopus microsporus TaxID=58291 RepID=A0A2G4SW88_RHIZD|nr:uncharacterized protein RHIMIDRAFT_281168 [Rhizopus microsporus ATCC 52813]ORE02926.1 hypothetical protein BCV72DRAFT_233830 [Rhizopus microsporus var. microsporus]PHZ13002.1 hypothetical protein RHIMIDRAFT_281168 [Rhizopus microsporus ATCC 52813]
MGLLKIGSLYKKNKKKSIIEQSPPVAPPSLPTLSLDEPLKPRQEQEQQTVTAGSGSLFDDILAELNSPTAKKEESLLDDFSLALALSQKLDLNHDEPLKKKETPKTTNQTVEKKQSNLLTGDSIYSNYLKNLSALDDTSSPDTSMFSSLLNASHISNNNKSTTPIASSSTPTLRPPVTTMKVLDSDISDSEESKKDDDEDEDGRVTRGIRPIMERRTQDHRLKRKIDSWTNRVDPNANRVESNEAMIERMKDRHRNQVKLAALQRQQEMQNMMMMNMVPQPYVLQHPGNLMMDTNNNSGIFPSFPATVSSPPPLQQQQQQLPLPQQQQLLPTEVHPQPAVSEYPQTKVYQQAPHVFNNGSNITNSNTSLYATQATSTQSSLSSAAKEEEPKQQEDDDTHDEGDGAEADGEISEDDESYSVIQRKKSFTSVKGTTPSTEHRRTMRSSRSTPNLKKSKKKSSHSRRNSQDHSASTPSSSSDYPLTPPLPHHQQQQLLQHQQQLQLQMQHHPQQLYQQQGHLPQQPIRHMKSEPELIHRRKTQQMMQHQQQLQHEWDRMQAYQREQQLKLMQQQQYMSMYPVMYYNQPMMMQPSKSTSTTARMSHSHSFHTTPR